MAYIGKVPTAVPLTSADIQDGTIALADLSATGTKDATTFLRGDNTFASAGGDNTPAFFVRMSSNQSTTNGAINKVQLDVEDYDTDSCFDNSTNYRFTPTTAGKYFFFAGGRGFATSGTLNYVNVLIRKNGTAGVANTFTNSATEQYSSPGNSGTASLGIILNMNGTTDYVELYMQVGGTSPQIEYSSNGSSTFFGGYKIIE